MPVKEDAWKVKRRRRNGAHAAAVAPRVFGALLMAALVVLSLTVGRAWLTSTGTYAGCIDSLDEKKETVMNLAAAATAASAAITVIPDDIGTPIADKLADLSVYLMLILGTLYLEKYLLTIIGWTASCFLVPGAGLMLIGSCLGLGTGGLKRFAVRLLLFSAVIVAIIPLSLTVSSLIEHTYEDSIRQTISMATEVEEAPAEAQGERTFWQKITGAASRMVNGVSETVDWAKHVLNNFMEAIAVLLVTDCVIPVLVLLFSVWLVRQLFRSMFDREGARAMERR